MILYEPPRTALEDVAAATIFEPFSNSILPLFHAIIPCCIQSGKFSYASCNLPNISLAVADLLASTAILTLGLNKAKCKRYEMMIVDLPDCLGNLWIVNLLLCIEFTISLWKPYISNGTRPWSRDTILTKFWMKYNGSLEHLLYSRIFSSLNSWGTLTLFKLGFPRYASILSLY